MTEPQYTYGGFTYEAVTVVVRGGSVPGPRHLTLELEPGDAEAPEWQAFLRWFNLRREEKLVASQALPPTFGGISM